MISSLHGIVEDMTLDVVTLSVNGVGYEVFCTRGLASSLETGEEYRLTVYTDVKEDSIRLYGFQDKLEKQVFLLLIKVSGVGARSAVEILSNMDKVELLRAIGSADTAKLQRVKGIGKKTSERIVVELKDKVAEFADQNTAQRTESLHELPEALQDALAAMVALGFSKRDAERAIASVQSSGKSAATSGDIVREALKFV